MDTLLLIFAWAAGLLSLFLVVDMIAADIAQRRAERLGLSEKPAMAENQPRPKGEWP